MRQVRSVSQEAAEDIFFGQVVILWARWFVIATTAMIFIWGADSASELGSAIALVITLMAINFYLHGRYLVERPANPTLLMLAGVMDLAVITATVGLWDQTGLPSPYFILYYPVVFAFALVFPPRFTTVFTGLSALMYIAVCFVVDTGVITDASELKRLVMRIIILAAMGGLGTYYWRIQRERRQAPAPRAVGA